MDKASFNKDIVEIVWGTFPTCIKGCKRAMDLHHIMGRGNKKNGEDRKKHSSIFNCIPLCRECHDGDLHSRQQALKFLYEARKRIEKTIHFPTGTDVLFIEKYSDYYPSRYYDIITD